MPINIIFDADDTLWYTEFLYDEARAQFVELLSRHGLGEPSEISELSRSIDQKNFKTLQFSRKRFPKSLVDTYKQLHGKRRKEYSPEITSEIKRVGESVFERPGRNVEKVEDLLHSLQQRGVKLFLWTQGDEVVQRKRIRESGLEKFFAESHIDITSTKTSERLKRLLERHSLNPEETWVVGNSIKSDINPALEIGLNCIWIPSNVWDRERDKINFPPTGEHLYQVSSLEEIKEIIFKADNDREIEEQSKQKEGVVYLFVSAYQDLYRQYVLDILAYPRGFIFSFPYDAKRWLPRPFREDPDQLTNLANSLKTKQAMVVFVDERIEGEPRRLQRFLPIREAKISNGVEIKGGLLHIEFELGNYVIYKNRGTITHYDGFIRSIAARPRPNIDDCSYLSIGPNFINNIVTETKSVKDDDAWQTIIETLGNLNGIPRNIRPNPFTPKPLDPFEKAMFFRVMSIEELVPPRNRLEALIPSKKRVKLKRVELKTFFGKESGYEVRNSKNYRLNLLFYSPNRPHSLVRRSKVIANFSSEFINPVGRNEIPLSFRYDRRHVDFITDRVFTDIWTSISIVPETPKDQGSSSDDQIVTPQPNFLIKISTNPLINFILPVIFALSTIVSTLNAVIAPSILKYLPSSWKLSEQQVGVMLAVVGSTIATYLLFNQSRRLK